MVTGDAPSIGLSRGIKWIFPTGAILSVVGISLSALLSVGKMQTWESAVLISAFFPVLFVGSAFVIIGSFLDRQRLSVRQFRLQGILCWVVSAALFCLLALLGGHHAWTFTLMFPAFAGFIAGIVLLP